MNTKTPNILLAQVRAPSFNEGAGSLPPQGFDTASFEVEESAQVVSPWAIPFYDSWTPYAGFAFVLVLIFLIGTLYNILRIRQIRASERAKFEQEPPGLAMSMFLEGEEHGEAHRRGTQEGLRWEQVLEHVRSDNQNDWRLAIIEADIMLDHLTISNGYVGETLSDRLKQADTSHWNTIPLAWEAHRARNKVAHKGTEHELTQREARRIIGLFEQVFKEFNYIE